MDLSDNLGPAQSDSSVCMACACFSLAVLGDAASIWRIASRVEGLLAERQLTPRQIAVCAWGCAKTGVVSPALWKEFGEIREPTESPLHRAFAAARSGGSTFLSGEASLLSVQNASLADVAMTAWAFAKMRRVKAQEINALRNRALVHLEGVVATAVDSQEESGGTSSRTPSSSKKLFPPSGSPHREAACSPCSAHDVCMLLTAFSELTPRDSAFALRALFCLLLLCRGRPVLVESPAGASDADDDFQLQETPLPATASSEGEAEENAFLRLLSAASLTAQVTALPLCLARMSAPFFSLAEGEGARLGVGFQGLTGAWVALRRFGLCDVFELPKHKTPDSRTRHSAYEAFDAGTEVGSLLSLLKEPGSEADSSALPGAQPRERQALLQSSPAAGPLPSKEEEEVRDPARPSLRSASLLRRSSALAMLEALCEETRVMRLDHTVNSGAAASLAEAFAGMRVRHAFEFLKLAKRVCGKGPSWQDGLRVGFAARGSEASALSLFLLGGERRSAESGVSSPAGSHCVRAPRPFRTKDLAATE